MIYLGEGFLTGADISESFMIMSHHTIYDYVPKILYNELLNTKMR
jgi:hypothetical protein